MTSLCVVPINVLERVKELKKSLDEDEITDRGYVKQFRNIISKFLNKELLSALHIHDDELKNEEITEKGFYIRCKRVLNSLDLKNEEMSLDNSPIPADKENNQNIENQTGTDVLGLVGAIKEKVKQNDRGTTTSRTNENGFTGFEKKTSKTEQNYLNDTGDSGNETQNKEEDLGNIESILHGGEKMPSSKSSKAQKRQLRQDETRKMKRMKNGDSSQPSLASFCSTNNRKSDEVVKDTNCSQKSKTCGLQVEDKKNREEIKPAPLQQEISTSRRCCICSQRLNSEDLRLYPGHPENAMDEFVALTDPRLSLFTGEEDSLLECDMRPQHKITSFSVYDKQGHLCPFDGGLIERNVLIYFSGFLKPIYDENPSVEDGVPSKDMGPINEWFISGFDGGEKVLVGFSTAFADYFLMEPSELYSPFFEAVVEKIYISKLVIELLVKAEEPSYEDLLLKVQTAVPPPGISSFSEESLLRHAQFICDQVHNFDLAGDEYEEPLLSCPCMRSLMTLAGVTPGAPRASRHRGGVSSLRAKKMPKFTMASTTPLVKNLFESFFANQIASNSNQSAGPRKTRCGVCEKCQEPDCGNCNHCRNMVKFGGTGRAKQCCVNRRCPNMCVSETQESDGEDEEMDQEEELGRSHPSRVLANKKRSNNAMWIGEPIASPGSKVFYNEVEFNSSLGGDRERLRVGDCVMVEPSDPKTPVYIAMVESLFELSSANRKIKYFHASWFCRGSDTILGEAADPNELFLVNDCEDTPFDSVLRKVTVIKDLPPADWRDLGGIETPEILYPIKEPNDHTFFYQKWYHPEFARFEDIPPVIENKNKNPYVNCQSCLRIQAEEATEFCKLSEKVENGDSTSNAQCQYERFKYFENEYEVGDFAYVDPDAFSFKLRQKPCVVEERKKQDDDIMYPEYYRKTSDKIKGSNDSTPEPFKIVRIICISCKEKQIDSVSPEDVILRVQKLYRPEDTHKGVTASYQADLNLVYWSEEEAKIPLSHVRGKCSVVFGENLPQKLEDYFAEGPNRFYFMESYDWSTKEFSEPPTNAQMIGRVGKGKGGKGKGKSKSSHKEVKLQKYPNIANKLATLDVFAGCGGLSEGMRQAGLCKSRWAVEVFEPAAQAFRLNNPDATVFTDDCNLLLKLAMEGKERNDKGQLLPQKGKVDMLCGGPPCQGFSGMNRFNSRQYSQFKNSLVASYLSFCDFYRPRYFVLENVRNFVSYKCGMVLKLTLRVLLKMGYQCTVGVLQAGNYGVAQTRRRAIILAAAPGEVLPLYPEPLTAFSPRACQLSVQVDNKKYTSNCKWVQSAPYRTTTVRDTMSDLPDIKNGTKIDQISYGCEPDSHFQKQIRGNQYQPVLRDHICKDLAPLVEARMKHIPTVPGADWRDLPNIAVRLSDGKFSKVLVYTHHDKKNGKSSSGILRGVCSCVEGRPCDPMDKQFGTLIPWCLPHTGNRHNHWSGLYGRLEWDGFFSTTVTNPEPMGKQGRVLHPEQNRVVSVRECARSQGFPDTYRFYGSLLEKHRQVGNAVPPPMAKAIGLEIMKAIERKEQREQ